MVTRRAFLLAAPAFGAARETQDPLKRAAAYLQKMRETADFSYVEKAASLVDLVLTKDPANYEALRLRLQIAMNYHRFPKAIEQAKALLERNPRDTGVIGLWSDALVEMGDYPAAGRVLQRLVRLGGGLHSFNRIAWHRFVTGRPDEALLWMARAVQAGSPEGENEAWCEVEFGEMLLKTGRTDAAKQAFERALAKFPGYHRAYAGLGRTLACAGDLTAGVVNFKKAQSAVPFPEYAGALETLYRAKGNQAEADRQRAQVDAIERLATASGERGNRTLALLFADSGRRLDRAYELAKGEFEMRGGVYNHDALAWVLFKMGKVDEASAEATKALSWNTPEPAFHYHAGFIASAAGDKQQSVYHLQTALKLNPNFDWIAAPAARAKLDELG